MTHKRLLRELAPGEFAYWLAHFELEAEAYERARADAEKKTQRKRN